MKSVVGYLNLMRTVCVIFFLIMPVLVHAQSYRVSDLKFQNFKAYAAYDITLETVKSVLINFSKENPSFEQTGIFVLAAKLSQVYRDKGLSFHRVEVVLGNPVKLVLIPGVMASIDVRGNTLYTDKQIEPFFYDLFGKLVDSATLQKSMLRLNSLPGINGFAFLSFGQQPGDAVLNVNANSESWGQLSTRLNNYGSDSTGLYRASTQLTLNNPLKLSEQWRLGGSVSDSTENFSGSLGVDFHRAGRHIFSVSGQYQNTALDQELTFLNLSGWQASGQLQYQFKAVHSFKANVNIFLDTGYLDQRLTNDSGISNFDVNVKDIPIGLKLAGDLASNKLYLGYEVFTQAGYLFDYKAPVVLDDDYWAFSGGEISLALSVTGGGLQQGVDFKTKISGQYALSALPSHRRFGLTGPSKVASYASGSATADSAVFAESTLALINFNIGPVQTVLQMFGQAGIGVTSEQETDLLIATGASLDLNIGPLLTQTNFAIDENFDNSKIWFEVTLNWPKGN